MIKNYLLLALRNLLKRKVYSFINIFGLAVGMAVCLVILKYVDFEVSYDNFNQDGDRVFRMVTTYYRAGEAKGSGPMSGFAEGPALAADLPEVSTYVRTHPMYGGAVVSYLDGSAEPRRFRENDMLLVDSTFLDVFTYPLLQGDKSTALDQPNSIVLSVSAASKYFGKDVDPIGKTLQLSGGWSDGDYMVTGVMKDVPQNSHLSFDFLLNIHNLLLNDQYTHDDGWGWQNFNTYVQLRPHTKVEALASKMSAFVDKYRGKDDAKSNTKEVFTFQPIRSIHLRPDVTASPTLSSNKIYFFIVISIFILAIAWVNYINLSTARAMERAREVGIKKAIGALRKQLISQFALESFLVNGLGVILAVFLAMALLPVLGDIVGKNLSFDFADPRIWIVLTGLFLAGSVISGAYPAFVLSSFNVATVLKGGTEKITGGISLRKILVVFQFASSVVLIAGTFAIYRQIKYMKNEDKGFTMDQMLIFGGPKVIENKGAEERVISFKNELARLSFAQSVATSGAIPGGGYNWGTSMRKAGFERDRAKFGTATRVDPDFINTYGLTLISGKVWNPDVASEMKSIIINEASVDLLSLGSIEKALQEKLVLGNDTFAIQGVLKNYHWNSPKAKYEPMVFIPTKTDPRYFSVHLSSANMSTSIAEVEKLYKQHFPGNPFDFYFLDDFFNKQYQDDLQFGKIFSLFALLAIIIACLGLWALASFTTTQKLKEIGVRKVLGASVSSIMSLLSTQFLKLIIFASVIAMPLTWYGINSWLGGFAFRIGLTWDLFVVPVLILTTIAMGSVCFQIFRGANINPAKVLRSE
jgi:putative ABC transport system permease protein